MMTGETVEEAGSNETGRRDWLVDWLLWGGDGCVLFTLSSSFQENTSSSLNFFVGALSTRFIKVNNRIRQF